MKPTLLIGKGGCGKTTRLLETVKWLNACIICHSHTYKRGLQNIVENDEGFKNLIITSNLEKLRGRNFDIICVEEWRKFTDKSIDEIYIISDSSKIKPIFTERLNDEHFDIEIMQ